MIYLGADHAGFRLKEKAKTFLRDGGFQFEDLGAASFVPDDDYPDVACRVAREVAKSPDEHKGIIFGGSGQGEAMVANRIKGIRAVVFYGPRAACEAVEISGRRSDEPYELVRLSRFHNDANVLSIGSRFVNEEEAIKIIQLWLNTEFSGEERHTRRIKKIDEEIWVGEVLIPKS